MRIMSSQSQIKLDLMAFVASLMLAMTFSPGLVNAQSQQLLDYSTLLGSRFDEQGRCIVTDESGFSYVMGNGRLSEFPSTIDPYVNGYDLFIAKFDPSGNGPLDLVWSTIIGGPGFEYPGGITLDTSGNIYLVGTTDQPGFPTTDGTTLIGSESIFVIKLNNQGVVQYSSIVAEGTADDREQPDIAVSVAGDVYITGRGMNGGNEDALVARFSQTGLVLKEEYRIFLGGSDLDLGAAIEVDISGNAYVTGRTNSTNFPTKNGYQRSLNGTSDIFFAKIGFNGSLEYSTYLGGSESNDEMGVAIAVDSLNRAYITGRTNALDFPVKSQPVQPPSGQNQAFLAVIDPGFSGDESLLYSNTWLGGSFARGTGVAVDSSFQAYVVGTSISDDMPTTPDALFPNRLGKHDGFLTVIDHQSGNAAPQSSTYFGGIRDEWIQGIDLYEVGTDVKVHAVGHTKARTGFPVTPGAYQQESIRSSEVFFSVFGWFGQANASPSVVITSPQNASTFDTGTLISFVATATDAEDGDISSALNWTSSIDGQIGTGSDFPATLSDGNHSITASVTDGGGKIGSDSISITVGNPPAQATDVTIDPIGYGTTGGKNRDKHVLVTVTLTDNLEDLVTGASVVAEFFFDGVSTSSGDGTTGIDGSVTFTIKNTASGTYTTIVHQVTAAGLIWDGITPGNSFQK